MARSAQFKLDISRWVEKVKQREDVFVRHVALDILGRVILKSPVGNPSLWKHPPPPNYVGGRFRNNWQVAIGSPAGGTLDKPDASGAAALNAGQSVIAGAVAGDTIFIVNNLPYAVRLEFGWSTQAPAGMVRTTLAEFGDVVETSAAQARQDVQ